jgi:hypothetical protein
VKFYSYVLHWLVTVAIRQVKQELSKFPCQLGIHQWYVCVFDTRIARFVEQHGDDTITYRFCLRCYAPVSKLPHRNESMDKEARRNSLLCQLEKLK